MKIITKKKGSVYCNIGAWNALNKQLKGINPTKIFILTDTHTKKHCLPHFLLQFSHKNSFEILEMPVGEASKNIQTCLSLWNQLSNKGADRNCLLINLGGGVVTDLGGFVASTFKRGIDFINIPTSLLAMVDASVGGKNGVDLGVIKNQIGVINNPHMVIIDTHFLKTLAKEEMKSGFAEMLKHGLIYSEEYWNKVNDIDDLYTENIEELIWESVLIKNEIVTKDPFENDLRKTLNYGHTLGHAIESYSMLQNNINPLLHGEAVAIGMILATYISNSLLNFPEDQLNKITRRILKKFPKVVLSSRDKKKIINLLVYDKKNSNGKVLFVLLKEIGKHKINCEVSNDLILNAFEYYETF